MDAIMVSFDFEELLGTDTFFGKQIARGARNLACSIWNKYPDQWTKGDALTSPVKFFWNSVCEAEAVNKQPIPQTFTGGQCPVMYDLYILHTYVPGSASRCGEQDTFQYWVRGVVRGPIKSGSVRFVQISPVYHPCNSGNRQYYTGRWEVQDGLGQWIQVQSGGAFPDIDTQQIIQVARSDGQVDNCGNPPPYFPTTQLPAPGQESKDVIINDGNDISLTVPLGWFDIDFSVPIKFEFSVGDVVIDVGGITVNFDKDNTWNIEDNVEPVSLPQEEIDKIDDIQNTVKDVEEILEEEKKEFDKIEYDEQVFNTCTFLEFTDSSVDYVEIIVTKVPVKGKLIANINPNDTFFWAGYFCWTVGNSRTTHVVVQKSSNFYKKPDWATGFAFFCVNDACARIIVYTKKITPA